MKGEEFPSLSKVPCRLLHLYVFDNKRKLCSVQYIVVEKISPHHTRSALCENHKRITRRSRMYEGRLRRCGVTSSTDFRAAKSFQDDERAPQLLVLELTAAIAEFRSELAWTRLESRSQVNMIRNLRLPSGVHVLASIEIRMSE